MNSPPTGGVLLDTDVVSFVFNQDKARVPRYDPHFEGRSLYVSFVTVAEMRFGARIRGWGTARCDALEHYLERYAIVESTSRIGVVWAQVRADA